MKTSLDVQKTMNNYLAKRQFRLAYKSFLKMNELRKQEGMDELTLPNLQSRYE